MPRSGCLLKQALPPPSSKSALSRNPPPPPFVSRCPGPQCPCRLPDFACSKTLACRCRRWFSITRRIHADRAHWAENLNRWVYEQGWDRSLNLSAIANYRPFDVSTFPDLPETPSYFNKEVKQYTEMNYEELRRYIRDLQQSGFDVVRLRVQLQKKLSYPLIALIMAVLAIPFSLSTGKKGAITGVAVAVGIAVFYTVVSRLFEAMGGLSQLPPALAAWSPDLIFILVGGYLILKVPT